MGRPGTKIFFVVLPWVLAVFATLMAVSLISLMPPHMPRVAAACGIITLIGLVLVSWVFAWTFSRNDD